MGIAICTKRNVSRGNLNVGQLFFSVACIHFVETTLTPQKDKHQTTHKTYPSSKVSKHAPSSFTLFWNTFLFACFIFSCCFMLFHLFRLLRVFVCFVCFFLLVFEPHVRFGPFLFLESIKSSGCPLDVHECLELTWRRRMWASWKGLPSLPPWKLTCPNHQFAEDMLVFRGAFFSA